MAGDKEKYEKLQAAKSYYNKYTSELNDLIRTFPSNIVGFFRRYKKKSFYSDEKREMFEILKDR